MVGVLILGFTLSLDNFRTAVALGGLKLGRRHSLHVALAFGFWDAVAPLIGILIGQYMRGKIGATADAAAAITLGAYGLYLIVHAWRTPAEPERFDHRWALFGLPLPLSLDNVVAGTSLGLVGLAPWVAPPLFGAITAFMSLVGLQLGRGIAHFIHIRSDLLTGVALVVMGGVLGLGLVR